MVAFMGFRGRSLERAVNIGLVLPCYILFGYNHAVGGGLLSLPSWTETFPEMDTVNTTGDVKIANSKIQGTVMAIYTLGCFLGCMNCIWVGDKLGRRMTIVAGAAVNILGSILQCTAFGLPQLAIGRLVTGFGFGHITATAPNLQAELCGADHRGASVLLEGVFISLGLALSAWVDLGMSFTTGSISWRFPLALSIFWAAIVMSTTPFMPESPRWLVKKGRVEEARRVLAALGDLDKDSAEIASDIEDINESLAVASQGRFSDIWSNASPQRLLHRTCLACAGQLFHQLSGVNALAFYQAKIFEERLGLGGLEARILAGAVFTFQFLVSPAGVLTVDRFGRRKLMVFSAIGMGVCLATMAGTTAVAHNTAAMGVAVTAIFMFSFFFPIGFLGIPFLYAAEMAPLSHRVPITSMSTGTAWLFNFAIAEVTPMGFASLGWRYFIVYAATNFFFVLPTVYFLFPETNGRRLEEIDQVFANTTSIWHTVKDARRIHRMSGSSSEEVGRVKASSH
ncbi:sugar transporter [Echria macrotheca]|uniref:Sugar transporter n=1 Tax=Echria macrotheca TaxID=438768 RepID=A0AAJ0BNT6_9PEZI|nr:sugar transporter [Echria macrotheca]